MKKNFLLLFLMALLPLAGWAQGTLNGSTQYGENGLKYKILSVYNTEVPGTKENTVSVSQNVYATNGSASIVIPPTVTINVQGTDDETTPVAINKAVTFKVVEIETDGFKNVTTGGGANVTSIQIGSNIKTIGANAFDGCSNVTEITFNDNTNDVDIKDDAFKGTKVTSLDLTPLANMTTVNKWFNSTYAYPATSNNTLTSVTFPSKLTNIVADAFGGCKKLATVTFPVTGLAAATYLTIGAGAFSETAIVDLDLTEAKIQTLNKLFEDNNVTLNTVKMAKSVVTLAANALANCIQLNSVDFSEAVKLTTLGAGSLSNTVVAEYDFSNCYTLNPAGTAYSTFLNFAVGTNPFVNTTTTTNKNLAKVILPMNATLAYSPVTIIGTAFANCEALTEVTNLEVSNIITVAAGAFAGDISLTKLSFPETVTSVADAFGAGTNGKGCEKLAKLTFDGSAGVAIGDGTNPIYGNKALYGGVYPLEELYITVPAATPLTTTTATIAASALTNAGDESKLWKVEIAKDGVFAGTINAFALAEGEDAEVTFGKIAGATLTGQITGPTGTKTTELTVGEYGQNATQNLIVGTISKAEIKGAVTDGSVLTFIGQAVEIEFKGAITAIGAPAAPNAVLTTVKFNDVAIPANAVAATAFDENNAPLLTSVTWTPADTPAPVAAFAQKAFGTASVSAAAKVTLHTTTAVATLYAFSEANLFNVIFDALAPAPVKTTITVTGTASATYYYGKFIDAANITKIAKETEAGEQVTVYSAFVDNSDNKIYMDPLAIVDGYYVVAANQAVVVRMKNPTTAVAMTDADAGYVEGSKKAEVEIITDNSATPTMRYYISSTTIVNDLKINATLFSSDYIGTNFVGKTLFAMKNPAKVGELDWGKVKKTSYLPANSLFVQCNESAAARLVTVWLDGTENTTAIQNIIDKKATQNGAGVIYNLAGQKVGANYKGIIIKDGKKYFNK